MRKILFYAPFLLLSTLGANAQSISGTVFEDLNYGGGAGRSMAIANAIAAGSAVPLKAAATVELYDAASGTYITTAATSTAAGTLGQYTFSGLTSGTRYIVRVVNNSVRSTRTGATTTLLPVQTFVVRDGTDDVNRVGGEQPSAVDAAANTTNAITSLVAQSQAPVTVTAGATTGVDFGFCFDVIVNTNSTGQGSLRQFILNANALTDNASLQQVGQAAQRETSIFMIPDGAAHPGVRAGLTSQLTGSLNSAVAVITLANSLTLSDAGTVLDGTTQTNNIGNTNTATLGTGGTVGTSNLTLDKINGPEVELARLQSTTSTAYLLSVTGGQCTVRGLALHGSYNTLLWSGTDALLEGSILGCTATSIAQPANNYYTTSNGLTLKATVATVRNNLIGYVGNTGLNYSASAGSTGATIRDNEFVQNGQISAGGDDITIGDAGAAGPLLIEGNLISLANSSGIQLEIGSVGNNIIRNNTITGNGTGGTSSRLEGSGIHYLARNATVNSSNTDLITLNVIYSNQSSGIVINYGQSNVRISQNSIYQNGNGTTGGNGLLSIDFTAPTGYVGGDANYGQGDGVTPNDGLLDVAGTTAVPPHRQGNGGIDYPVLTSISKESSTSLRVQGYVGSAMGQTQFGGATVEIFSANNADTNQNGPIIVGDGQSVAHGEAQYYVGTVTAAADGSINAVITNPARSISSGDNITATAYLAGYGTSECGTNQVSNFTVLPVELTSFTATSSGPDVRLTWTTASELANDRFEVERSANGQQFALIGTVAGHGSTTQAHSYAFVDAHRPASRTSYYRLRQVDTDGSAHYSPVRAVALGTSPSAFAVYPAPVTTGTVTLDLTQLPAGEYTVRLLDLTGRLVCEQAVAGAQMPEVSLRQAPAGVYQLTVRGPGGIFTQRLVKQ